MTKNQTTIIFREELDEPKFIIDTKITVNQLHTLLFTLFLLSNSTSTIQQNFLTPVGMFCICASSLTATSHTWLLNAWKVASVTDEFYLK